MLSQACVIRPQERGGCLVRVGGCLVWGGWSEVGVWSEGVSGQRRVSIFHDFSGRYRPFSRGGLPFFTIYQKIGKWETIREYSQYAVSMHPTGMHACFINIVVIAVILDSFPHLQCLPCCSFCFRLMNCKFWHCHPLPYLLSSVKEYLKCNFSDFVTHIIYPQLFRHESNIYG